MDLRNQGFSMETSNLGRHFKDFCDFLEDPFAFLAIVTLDGSDDAGIQVLLQDPGADLVKSRFHSLDLTDDIDAIGIFLHHSNYTS
jgi:hypothetical protein